MARFGFCSGSYTSQSPNAADDRTLNLYPESIETSGKSAIAMYPTPGLQVYQTLAGSPVRGLYSVNGSTATGGGSFWFAVTDTKFYVNGIFTANVLGTGSAPGENNGMVSWANSATQLLFCSGGRCYVYNMVTTAFTTVSPGNFTRDIIQVAFCDGFFFALMNTSQQIYSSNLEDATTWSGTQTAIVSVFASAVLAIVENQRQIWLFGAQETVGYYDSGNFPFPFDVIPGSKIEQGCVSGTTVVKIDNSIIWLGQDARGAGMVWRLSGYTPTRISNHAVEFAFSQMPTLTDAIAYAYQDQGHTFYVLYFPTANQTWVYDVATQMWHERSSTAPLSNTQIAHRSQCHCYLQATAGIQGKHLVGDWNSGTVYQMAIPAILSGTVWSFCDDAGQPIQRLRRAPHVNIELEWMYHSELIIDMETGLGPIPPLSGSHPQVSLTWSDDGGHTFTSAITAIATAGQAGQYLTRIRFPMLGRSRQRVYQITWAEPVPLRIIDAFLKATPAYQPEERLVKKLAKSA